MKRFEAQESWLPASMLPRYASAVQRFKSREERFSSKVLMQFAATAAEGFAVKAQADGVTEVLLYDEIGYWGITAKDFVMALASIGPGALRLRINSPGGDVFDGLAIFNALRARTEPVTVVIDGIAASAASVIAMAGKTIEMPEQAMLMIHNCWGVCIGNRNDMIEMAAVQEKIDGQMAEVYAKKSGKPVADMSAAMDAETYYTSTEAKAAGLCDVILDAAAAAQAALAASGGIKPLVLTQGGRLAARLRAAALPAYDPDGDGDNDAQEALTLIQAAADLLDDACEALTGMEDDEGGDTGDGQDAGDAPGMPVVPGARRRQSQRAAKSEPEWVSHADEGLPIDTGTAWDGPAAAERMLDACGFNGTSPDPTKARRGFLVYDRANPKLKGSYKLPFADIVDGGLKALKSGLDASASRLPQTDIPDDVKASARKVIDAYEQKMKDASQAKMAADQRRRRLRLVQAETA